MRNDPGLFATMYSARALRRFKPDPVPDDVLFQLMDAAIRAPSGQNAQDWRFIFVRDLEHKRKMQTWGRDPLAPLPGAFRNCRGDGRPCRGRSGCRSGASNTSCITWPGRR